VPWGLYRFHQSRLPHFITFTCYRWQALLNTSEIRDVFLKILERARVRFDFLIYGFVIMPNHVHLLISEPMVGTLATVIQAIKIGWWPAYPVAHNCHRLAIVGLCLTAGITTRAKPTIEPCHAVSIGSTKPACRISSLSPGIDGVTISPTPLVATNS
jgi:hypothetical protein